MRVKADALVTHSNSMPTRLSAFDGHAKQLSRPSSGKWKANYVTIEFNQQILRATASGLVNACIIFHVPVTRKVPSTSPTAKTYHQPMGCRACTPRLQSIERWLRGYVNFYDSTYVKWLNDRMALAVEKKG